MYAQLKEYYSAIKNFVFEDFSMTYNLYLCNYDPNSKNKCDCICIKILKETHQSINNACLCVEALLVYLYFLSYNLLHFTYFFQYITFIIRKHNKSY